MQNMGMPGMGKVSDEIKKTTVLKKGMSVTHLFNVLGADYEKPEDIKEKCTSKNPCSFCRENAKKNTSPVGR